MLIKAVQQITHISDNPDINSQNYLESMRYINNLYTFVSKFKLVVDNMDSVEFIPSFKGKYTSEKLNIQTTERESELKYIVLKSELFLGDNFKNMVKEIMDSICNNIEFENEYAKFSLI